MYPRPVLTLYDALRYLSLHGPMCVYHLNWYVGGWRVSKPGINSGLISLYDGLVDITEMGLLRLRAQQLLGVRWEPQVVQMCRMLDGNRGTLDKLEQAMPGVGEVLARQLDGVIVDVYNHGAVRLNCEGREWFSYRSTA